MDLGQNTSGLRSTFKGRSKRLSLFKPWEDIKKKNKLTFHFRRRKIGGIE